jgi:hypothetical protein
MMVILLAAEAVAVPALLVDVSGERKDADVRSMTSLQLLLFVKEAGSPSARPAEALLLLLLLLGAIIMVVHDYCNAGRPSSLFDGCAKAKEKEGRSSRRGITAYETACPAGAQFRTLLSRARASCFSLGVLATIYKYEFWLPSFFLSMVRYCISISSSIYSILYIYLSIYLSIYYILFSHHGDINISDNDDDNNTLIIQKSSSRKDPFCGSDCVSAGSSRKDE